MLQSSKIKIINIPTNWVPKNPIFGVFLGGHLEAIHSMKNYQIKYIATSICLL